MQGGGTRLVELAWINATVADLRQAPDSRSERISQLPIFTAVEVLEARRGWVWIRGPDGYSGWVKETQIRVGVLPPPSWKVRVPWVRVRRAKGKGFLGVLPLDVRFTGEEKGQRIFLRWLSGETGWVPKKALHPSFWEGTVVDLIQVAQELVGVPYLWGGTTSFGFDCSGFVQRLFHFTFNIWLPRDSGDQQEAGQKVLDFSGLRAGDILCFPKHSAIYAGQNKMIHASKQVGSVVVTDLENDPYGQELRGKLLFGVRIRRPDNPEYLLKRA